MARNKPACGESWRQALAMRRALIYVTIAILVIGGSFLLNIDKWIPLTRRGSPGPSRVDWREFTCEEGQYKILMPGIPSPREESRLTWFGLAIKAKGWEVERREFPARFFVFHFEARIGENDVEALLDQTAAQISAARNGKLVNVKRISLDRHPGREAIMECPGKSGIDTQVSRFYFANNRHYHTAVVTPKKKASADYVTKFLDSFKLIRQ